MASHLLILSMQREVPPLLCHKRTLRVGAESHERAAAQTKAQSSCLSAVPTSSLVLAGLEADLGRQQGAWGRLLVQQGPQMDLSH